MFVLKDAKVVTGDGKAMYEQASVLVDRGRIVDVVEGPVASGTLEQAQQVIECMGKLVMPGIINHHTHGSHYGPIWPSASPTPTEDKVLEYTDRHLLGGTTTILNVCGFATVEDVAAATATHPLQVKCATSYGPQSVLAANTVDGKGFRPHHKGVSVEQQLKAGAVAIGEIGGGMTLAGGGQEYHFIPIAVKEATGKTLEPHQARKLKEAVLGRFADPADFDPQATAKALEEIGLDKDLTVDRAKEIVVNTVMPCLGPALKGFEEAALDAKKYQVHAIFHNAPQSMRTMIKTAEIGGELIIAAHSNHSNFFAQEAIDHARELRKRGALIDVATLDAWGAKRLGVDPELFYEFYQQGLVDMVSTDFAGGYFDPVIVGMEHAYRAKAASLPAIVATATYNVARTFPGLADERGLIAREKIADLVVTDPVYLSKVERVFIGGKVVVQNGQRC
jgi:imidazolonepropionase-like amidohydrolase